jgi:hypothetical protein
MTLLWCEVTCLESQLITLIRHAASAFLCITPAVTCHFGKKNAFVDYPAFLS